MPPSSPGETSAGQSTLSEAAVPVGGEAEARPRPKKRHQKRLQRPSGDARLANKRANQGEPEPRARRAVEPWDGMLSEDLCTCVVYSVVSTSSE